MPKSISRLAFLIHNWYFVKTNVLVISCSIMNEEYYLLTSELDAREILRYLNNLGIHNISGEVLKYFITGISNCENSVIKIN